jgi:hypothetical protein
MKEHVNELGNIHFLSNYHVFIKKRWPVAQVFSDKTNQIIFCSLDIISMLFQAYALDWTINLMNIHQY